MLESVNSKLLLSFSFLGPSRMVRVVLCWVLNAVAVLNLNLEILILNFASGGATAFLGLDTGDRWQPLIHPHH